MTGQDLKDLRKRWGDGELLCETGWQKKTLHVYSSKQGELPRRTALQLHLATLRLSAAERRVSINQARRQRPWYQRMWEALLNDE